MCKVSFFLFSIYVCSLILVPHLFTTHETCIPLCLKWQRSLKHVNYVFTYANRKNAGQPVCELVIFISTRVHQWSGGTDGRTDSAHREITFNR